MFSISALTTRPFHCNTALRFLRSFSGHLVDEAGADQLRRFLVAFEVFEEDVGVEGADGVEIAEENGLLAHQARRNEIFQLGIVHLRGITLENASVN